MLTSLLSVAKRCEPVSPQVNLLYSCSISSGVARWLQISPPGQNNCNTVYSVWPRPDMHFPLILLDHPGHGKLRHRETEGGGGAQPAGGAASLSLELVTMSALSDLTRPDLYERLAGLASRCLRGKPCPQPSGESTHSLC